MKRRASDKNALVVACAILVAAAFRIPRLTGYGGLAGHEAYSLALAQRSLVDMFHRFTYEANGLIYALLQWPLSRIDESVLVLRLPAFVAGVLTAAALYWAAAGIVTRAEAAAAAWPLAISPMAIAYSQLARPYVFAMLFGTLAYGCLARVEGDRRYWVGFVAAMVIAGYSNALSVPLLLAAQAVFVFVRQRLARGWLISLIPMGVLLAPLGGLLLAERAKRDPLYWLSRPTAGDATSLASDFMAGRKPLLLGAVVVAASFLLQRLNDRRMVAVAAWAVLPPLLLFLAAQFDPTFWPGYLLPALPGTLLLVGSAAIRLPRFLAVTCLALLTAGFLYGVIPTTHTTRTACSPQHGL